MNYWILGVLLGLSFGLYMMADSCEEWRAKRVERREERMGQEEFKEDEAEQQRSQADLSCELSEVKKLSVIEEEPHQS